MKKRVMNALEVFAKAMVQPLSYLAVAGMIMVLGVLLTNSTVTGLLPFLKWEPIQIFGDILYQGVMLFINNLHVVFAIGIPAALAKKDKHQAALVGFLSYITYLKTSNVLLDHMGKLAEPSEMLGLIGTGQAEILGIQCVDMGVFGGIILGCITGYVFNRTFQKNFKGAFQIYSGTRFSYVIMFAVSIIFGVASNFLWPFAQQGIAALAELIKGAGTFGLFLYGFLERLLVPTGLHHLIYTPFQFSDLGGVLQVGDTTVAGAYAIVMAEFQMPVERFSDSIYYMATGFTKMFGYIGIGAAFIHTAYKENKKRVKALVIPNVVTACLAAITEPLDFMFIFCAPVLYLVHSVIAGLFIALLKICDVTAFCGGNLLASVLLNLSAGVEKTHWPMMFVLGAIEIIVYFVVFSFIIKKFNYKTPGREDVAEGTSEDKKEESKANTGISSATEKIETKAEGGKMESLVAGLGGKENINTVENCFTRLRVNVNNPELLDEKLINVVPNSGIVKKDNDIQIIIGLTVADVRKDLEDYLEKIN